MNKLRQLLAICLLITVGFFVSCNNKKSNNESSDEPENAVNGQVNDDTKGTPGTSDRPQNPNYKPVQATILGFVKGGANVNVILDELDIGNIYPMYSAVVDENGGFRFDFTINEPSIYQLRFPNGSIHLFLRGGTIRVNTSLSNIGNYEIIGSTESMHLKEMYFLLNETNAKTIELQDRVEVLKKDKNKVKELLRLVDSLPIYYAVIAKNKSKRLMAFVDRLDTSMIALMTAFYVDANENYDYLIKVRDKFKRISPHSRFYKQLDDKLAKIVPVVIGKDAPTTVANDVYGKQLQLASLKGKTVLLYFWASYSEPCRLENPKIVEVFNKYKSKGFEVFAVSLDNKKEPWTDAIKEDKMNWKNVSNLLGWDDELSLIWKIDDIPYLILIDKNGKIIDRGFRAFELESKLQKAGL